ncbi:MAG TPA: UdgX family uracil-DNA binding protein [Mycobacteriales bacterium]|nr:UdgX family uracil-DNA binding protein [Mycobacteriales bacterium]
MNAPPASGATAFVPVGTDLEGLRRAAASCHGCRLWEPATQTVFGAGSPTARVVLVGEQPGDLEDRRGLPFVGPAGKLLDRALQEAGIDRAQAYVTNVVKHFSFTTSGTRRIHQTPDLAAMSACRPWLDAELALLTPEVVVALGATAGKALLGPDFRVSRQRGVLLAWPAPEEDAAPHAPWVLATLHPSAVLRADDRDAAYAGLLADLRIAAGVLAA